MVKKSDIAKLHIEIMDFYRQHSRAMPWREDTRPYYVLVSELMLQQTQVSRVVPKFEAFIKRFPTIEVLAEASQAEVIDAWSGLGYNRRARFLHQAAQTIVSEHGGSLPERQEELIGLPGVGPNTAGAIRAYAYNQPAVFIETNIRAVFIDAFFPGQEKVDDKVLLPIIEQAIDQQNPREWYWAIMDYGTDLKSRKTNPSRRSAQHVRQSKFEGSRRQIRGKVLRLLRDRDHSHDELLTMLVDERSASVLEGLVDENMIFFDQQNKNYTLGH